MPLVVVLDIIFSIQNQSRPDITVTLSDLSPCPIRNVCIPARDIHILKSVEFSPIMNMSRLIDHQPLSLSLCRYGGEIYFRFSTAHIFGPNFGKHPRPSVRPFPVPSRCSPMILIASQSGYSCCFLYPKSSSKPTHTGFFVANC